MNDSIENKCTYARFCGVFLNVILINTNSWYGAGLSFGSMNV